MTATTTPNASTPAPATAPRRERTASVTLFKPNGRYYTIDSWRVPFGATGPSEMNASPDFRQIDGGAVLVETDAHEEYPDDENFGVPHLIFAPKNAEVEL